MNPISWKDTTVSSCGKFHLFDGRPLYSYRFDQVLKFHSPGLAPVKDHELAYHITIDGLAAYLPRFCETFGFYEDLAAVRNEEGYFHINPEGLAMYSERYAWCGNFQEGLCPVRDLLTNGYFHIGRQGQRSYTQQYRYVGDFKEMSAVVCNETGLHSHIDHDGRYIHNHWFIDLDVFHKGYARAKDNSGWFHIDKSGHPIYQDRYISIEPFYNGLSRVETHQGRIIIINPKGEVIYELRSFIE